MPSSSDSVAGAPPAPTEALPAELALGAYQADEFSTPEDDCDLVMKGGVTSGLVYPYAVLELARRYRFRSIGGTSAGAIAAAFAAAAEYARTVRKDEGGFMRLKSYCDALPDQLVHLFQPAPPFVPIFRAVLRAQAARSPWRAVGAAVAALWGGLLLGALFVGVTMAVLKAGWAGIVLGGLVGVVLAIVLRLWMLIKRLPAHAFGMCSGITQPDGYGPGLTNWLHSAIQDIAFDDPEHAAPLTFGDLNGADANAPTIDLRMVTTNLSMRRPHTLPKMGMSSGFLSRDWRRLFPAPIMTYLEATSTPLDREAGFWSFPAPNRLPVLVAVRMSLSFPLLFAAIPVQIRDLESALIARGTGAPGRPRWKTAWFSDGGLSSNFPIHMFDALLPTRPTFALSLDDLPAEAREDGRRVFIPTGASERVGLPVHPIEGAGGFVMALLGAAKDWQDGLLANMSGQRERIARVYLSRKEGGLNLTMPPERARTLMAYGQTVGREFVRGAFDFREHRWKRALSFYEQLEQAVHGAQTIWMERGFGPFLKDYATQDPPEGASSYKRVGKADRRHILARLAAFAKLSEVFTPRINNASGGKFPRPTGRLRIGPDY